MRRLICLNMLLMSALAPGLTWAAWMTDFEGHSVFSVTDGRPGSTVCVSCDAIISFKVYHNDPGDDWVNDLGLISVATDLWPKAGDQNNNQRPSTTGKEPYVYFYFVNNTNPISKNNDQPLQAFNLSYGVHDPSLNTPAASPYLSGGFLSHLVFADFSSATEPGDIPDNGKLETDSCAKDNANCVGNFHGGDPGTNPIAPMKLSQVTISTSGVHAGTVSYDAMQWEWSNTNGGLINPEDYSTVLFLTSDHAPAFRWADTVAPATSGTAGDVAAAPEPGSLALIIPGLLALRLRLRLSASAERKRSRAER